MPIDAAEAITRDSSTLDLNEADTRFQIIDRLLREVLGWPATAFKLEHSTVEGFADYILRKANGKPVLVIEAKRTGIYFQFPPNFNKGKTFRRVKVKTLLTDESLKRAMVQAQRYCTDEGIEYGAVSNGTQFVIFKAFEKGQSWRDLMAIAIDGLAWFTRNYADAVGLLGYVSVADRNSLGEALAGARVGGREVFFAKEKINSFNQTINANLLASTLRPIVVRFFGPIDPTDVEFVDRCYVMQRAHDKSLDGIRSMIRDSVSPFMATYGVQETEDRGTGGAFTNRLVKGIRVNTKSDVVVLFGGKGAGKSTFIRRLLLHKPPQYLKKHAFPLIVDLLSAPKDKTAIREQVWATVVAKLDTESILTSDREELLRLFDDRWQVAKRQDLKGFFEDSPVYNERLNALLAEWKRDHQYVANRLIEWHRRAHRGVIVAVDNTDQLENELQDFAFSLAVEISTAFNCLVLISMREERFYASKIRGMLDAYQNSAFHISSPTPEEVFERRIEFVLDLLHRRAIELEEVPRENVERFLQIFRADFRQRPASPLSRFISACAHGNIRLALDLFGELLLSGYTNATEMIQADNVWTVSIHQVLKPLLTPTRLFYDEKLSKVPNLFQLRSADSGSHFSGLRLLGILSAGQDPTSPAYVAMSQARSHFNETYGTDEEFRAWLDRLLSTNMVEASTRHDLFCEEIDAIRITPFGQFAITELHRIFTYVDLTATDCGVYDESVCNGLVRLTNQEVQLLNERRRLERVNKRIEKVEHFLDYLEDEESRELELLGLDVNHAYVPAMRSAWESEKPLVLTSAKKPKNR
jgi:hypothetical protein